MSRQESHSITNWQGFALPMENVASDVTNSGCIYLGHTWGDTFRWNTQVWPELNNHRAHNSTGNATGNVPVYERQPREQHPSFPAPNAPTYPGHTWGDTFRWNTQVWPELNNHRAHNSTGNAAGSVPVYDRQPRQQHASSPAPNVPIPGPSLSYRHTHGYPKGSPHASVPPNIGRKDGGDHITSAPNYAPIYSSHLPTRGSPHASVPPNIGRKDGGDHITSASNYAPIYSSNLPTRGYTTTNPYGSVPLNIGLKDDHETSRLTENHHQVQAFPRRGPEPAQIYHQSISIDRVLSAPKVAIRSGGGDKLLLKAMSKERKAEREEAGHEYALPSSKQNTSAKGIPIPRPVPRTESANSLPTRTHQSHGALVSTSTAQLPSTSDISQFPKPRKSLSEFKFQKNKKSGSHIPPEQLKLVLKEEANDYFNLAQRQENRPETELFLFQDPLVLPSIVIRLPNTTEMEKARVVTMATTQPVQHPTLATMTPTAAKSADQPEKPSRKRKKNQASVEEAAEEGVKPVKKPRKKKGEGAVESRTVGGESDRGATSGHGAEKQPRKKKKKKVEGEVVSALESGMVQLNVQDAASRNADVERAAVPVVHAQVSESDKNGRTEVAMAEERGKVEEKKTSGRGRKRKKPGDEGGSGSSQKKKKVKLEDEEMGGDESGNDEVDDPISGNNAITGEWARKRSRSSKSTNVKWTVFSGPKTDGNSFTKPKKASKSKRVASASVETTGKGATPERILRPNIWAASKSELVFVLPELSQSRSYNGVTESSSNFPMVLLDESTADSVDVQVQKSGGDGMVRLTLVRDFVCPLEELVGSDCNFASGSTVPSALVSNDKSAQPPQQEEDPEDSGLEYIDEPIPSTESIPAQPSVPGPGAMTLVSDSIAASLGHQQQPTMSSVPPSHLPIPTNPSSAPLLEPPISAHVKTENPIFGSTPIPRTLSPEIDILTSTSSLSLPIILISSKEVFNRAFSIGNEPPESNSSSIAGIRPKVGLGEEHAYVFWGFFKFREGAGGDEGATESQRKGMKVVNVWWDVVKGDICDNKVVGGRVEWVFDLEWVPGWDGSNNENENGGAMRPWWADVLDPHERFGADKTDYSEREKAKWMNLNLLPAQIADGQEEGSADEAMPRGWLCKRCGRLNQKVMMRHRWCGGVALGCRDNPVNKGYAVELWDTRDPRQTALAFPINVCDERRVDVRVADWDDGMRTLKYRPMTIALQEPRVEEVDGRGILKHVFTCNSEELQREATPLFSRIQRDVYLSKKIGDSGPYFKCEISDSYASNRDKYAFSCMTWENAPQVVRDVQDLMMHMGRSYGEDQDFAVDWITILGWISSGNRKASEKLSSKDRTVAMMCLGNDVILTITPKWEIEEQQPPALNIAGWEEGRAQSAPTGTLGMSLDPVVSGNVDAGVAAETQTSTRTHNNERPISAQTGVPAGKKSRVERDPSADTMSVTVVHGDMLLFSGCDFEYSIKRLGTSILVVGGN